MVLQYITLEHQKVKNISVKSEEITHIYENDKGKTINDLMLESTVTRSVVNESEELLGKLDELQAKYDSLPFDKADKSVKAKYNYRLKKIEESKQKITDLKKQIDEIGFIRKEPEITLEQLKEESKNTNHLYHGVGMENGEFKKSFIDKDGNLVLKSSSNFGGIQHGISLTDNPDVAFDYAIRIKGMPISIVNNAEHSKIIRIKKSALSKYDLVKEAEDEVMIKHSGEIKNK